MNRNVLVIEDQKDIAKLIKLHVKDVASDVQLDEFLLSVLQ